MRDYPIVDLSTTALLTTTHSVRRRLDLTKPVPIVLISVGTASATGFAHVLEVSAALLALGALCAALSITNPPTGCQPVPCDIAALCCDRPGVQPALAGSRSTATEPSRPR